MKRESYAMPERSLPKSPRLADQLSVTRDLYNEQVFDLTSPGQSTLDDETWRSP